MSLISFDAVTGAMRRLRDRLQHAFAVELPIATWSPEDQALLDRVADMVVRRGMAAPATMFLESMGPMNFLGGQALQFMSPIMEWAFPAQEIAHIGRLLERRETLARLVHLIEAKAAPQGTAAR